MIKVTRKDDKEANENIIRRFNRKTIQSGVINAKKETMRFSKPLSKVERRKAAIINKARQEKKARQMRMGTR